jgi:hypothetical protein
MFKKRHGYKYINKIVSACIKKDKQWQDKPIRSLYSRSRGGNRRDKKAGLMSDILFCTFDFGSK